MITNAQMNILEKIINTELQIDIKEVNRSREFVNGRLIFSYILYDRGVTYQRIAAYLEKNHATIIHMVKNAKHFLTHEPDLFNIYNVCKTIFENEHHPVLEYTHEELLKAYLNLELNLMDVEFKLKKALKEIKNNKNYSVNN